MSSADPKTTADEEAQLFYGRWTTEEEKYAEMLIEEFRNGNLDDADVAAAPSTLRGFLAYKLRCAPKRISKKFESSGYNGRMQYVCRKTSVADAEAEKRQEDLELLRQAFEARRSCARKKSGEKTRSSSTKRTSAKKSTGAKREQPERPTVVAASQFNPASGVGVPAAVAASSALAVIPTSTGGHPGFTTTDALLESFLAQNAATVRTSASSWLAAAGGATVTESLLEMGRTRIPGAAPSFRQQTRPNLNDSGLLRSLFHPAEAAAAAAGGLGGGPNLLAAEDLTRRLENAHLYAILQQQQQQESNNASATLLLQEQIYQRKRLQAALAAAGAPSLFQLPLLEGPSIKRPRTA